MVIVVVVVVVALGWCTVVGQTIGLAMDPVMVTHGVEHDPTDEKPVCHGWTMIPYMGLWCVP